MKFSSAFTLILALSGWMSFAEAKWSVSTYNIRNFDKDYQSGQTDTAELSKMIKEVKSDVMAFEEVVNQKAFEILMKETLPGYEYRISSCGGSGRQKTAVVFNPQTFEYQSQFEDMTFSGGTGKCASLRSVLFVNLKYKQSGAVYTFGVVHLKAGGDQRAFEQRWKQYLKLNEITEGYENKNLILLGDFNSTGYNIRNDDFTKFEDFLSTSSLRTTSENLGCTSYWSGTLGNGQHESSILDHIVVQDKNFASIESVKLNGHCAKLDCRPATPDELGVTYKTVSDHCPIQVTFK